MGYLLLSELVIKMFRVERAKSNRSRCLVCKKPLRLGEPVLRVGVSAFGNNLTCKNVCSNCTQDAVTRMDHMDEDDEKDTE